MKHKLLLALAALFLLSDAAPALAADHAVIFMYHRFGESQYPTTSIRLDQFEAHLKALKDGGYHVVPLAEVADALANGKPLPDKAVSITVDDAYASVYREAWPRLKAYGFPFTVFVSTKDVDGATGKIHMTWAQMREMAKAGVDFGNHSVTHPHMASLPLEVVRSEFAQSQKRFQEELGFMPPLMAYPYGEASSDVVEEAKKAGFKVAFGQHSGVAYHGAPLFYLPRFALNEHYGELGRFKQAIATLPLPVMAIDPADPAPNPSPARFVLTLAEDMPRGFHCFTADGTVVPVTAEGRKITATLPKPFGVGRGRLSCTAPGPDGRWRWFGHQVIITP